MDDKVRKWLLDIKQAGEEIEFFIGNNATDFEAYRNNILLKRAVERNLEIVGEAVSRILRYDSSYETIIDQSRRIVSLRNQIIHSYDNISDENVWSILLSHLPKLMANIKALLNEP